MRSSGLLDQENARFWNELCGSSLAKTLEVTDHSAASLKKFDDWYFGFYPYLLRYIPLFSMKGKHVLEVGLGYGTVSQRIGQAGAKFTGLDIAGGPVAMVNYRYQLHGLEGQAVRGNILDAPFEDSTFDYIVAIGSYHHTGDLQRAVDESYRILRPSGVLVMMVYNAYSYRRWYKAFGPTAKYLLWDYFKLGHLPDSIADHRASYDLNLSSQAAPYTTFVSRRDLRAMCRRFGHFHASLENLLQEGPFRWWKREKVLQPWSRFVGLDIYAVARR